MVGGPVLPEFDDDSKRGLRAIPLSAPAYDSSGPVPVIYGCGNCLITRAVFDPVGHAGVRSALQFSGRRRLRFLLPLPNAGLRFHWAAEAVITETVPQSRTSLTGWRMRSLRIGAINYHVQRKAAPTAWLRAMLTAKLLAALPLSLVYAACALLGERRRPLRCIP